jgi:hypothetical protein
LFLFLDITIIAFRGPDMLTPGNMRYFQKKDGFTKSFKGKWRMYQSGRYRDYSRGGNSINFFLLT